MSNAEHSPPKSADQPASGLPAEQDSRKPLPPAAERALAEAAARRAQGEEKEAAERPKEIGGQAGPEPVRYGDWEKKGIASDF